MITTFMREHLARRGYQLHRDQLENEFKNRLNDPHRHSIESFHHLLAGMVDGGRTELHGSWGWGAPTGWGKSTGLCTFFAAAEKTGKLLGQPGKPWNHAENISAIVTAARIESLYTLEKLMIKAGVPEHRIMVLHADTTGDHRPSDDGKDAPICLVAHNKLKYITKWDQQAQQEFLSYRGQVRDICLVDEAFNEAEATYVDEDFLADALRTLLLKAGRDSKANALLLDTLGPLLTAIEAENKRQEGLTSLDRAEGMIHPPLLSSEEFKDLTRQVKSVRLGREQRDLVSRFVGMLPSPIRLFRGKQSGVVSVVNTMPLCLRNRIELNASFEIGMLSALSPSMKNADDHFPMLQDLKTVYGLEGLADIIDYSDLTIIHLQRGGGKSTMAGHLADIRKQTDSTKEVMNFCIQAIKDTPLDQGVLICTYVEDGVEYEKQLKKVFQKAGIDLKGTVKDDNEVDQPRINFTTYGQHLGTNKFRFCSVGIAAGVQQRHKASLAGTMCGMRSRSVGSAVDFLEVDIVHQAVAGADAQQLAGRLQCRKVKDGKALPAKIYIVHQDSKDRVFRERLMKAFPRATWIDQASANKLMKSKAYQVCLLVEEYVKANYQGKPIPTPEVMANVTTTYKNQYRFPLLSRKLFADSIRLFLKRNPGWKRAGHALVMRFDGPTETGGVKDETKAA